MQFSSKLFFVLISVHVIWAEKILFLFPTISPSHLVVTEALSNELTKHGHEITVFSLFPVKNVQPNHRYFTVNDASLRGVCGSHLQIRLIITSKYFLH